MSTLYVHIMIYWQPYLEDKADAGGESVAIDDARLDSGDVKNVDAGVGVGVGVKAGEGVAVGDELTNGVGDRCSVVVGVAVDTGVELSDDAEFNSVGVVRLVDVVDGVDGDVANVAPEVNGNAPLENKVEAGSPVCDIGMSRITLFRGT